MNKNKILEGIQTNIATSLLQFTNLRYINSDRLILVGSIERLLEMYLKNIKDSNRSIEYDNFFNTILNTIEIELEKSSNLIRQAALNGCYIEHMNEVKVYGSLMCIHYTVSRSVAKRRIANQLSIIDDEY